MKGSGYSWPAYTQRVYVHYCVHTHDTQGAIRLGHVNASWCGPHPHDLWTWWLSPKESQEAYSLPLRNQSWVSRVIRSMARSIYYSGWKEAIAVSFVHQEFVKKQRRPRWSANVAITFEQSVFNEFHVSFAKITMRSLLVPCFQRINKVCSR